MGRPGMNQLKEKPKQERGERKQEDQGEGWDGVGCARAPPILLIID